MDIFEVLANTWRNHKGKSMGIIIGFAFAVLVLEFGFWQSLFIAICVLGGLFIGRKIDQKVDIKKKVDDIFRN